MATDNCKIKFGKSWIGMVTSDKVERMFAEVGVEVNDVLRTVKVNPICPCCHCPISCWEHKLSECAQVAITKHISKAI